VWSVDLGIQMDRYLSMVETALDHLKREVDGAPITILSHSVGTRARRALHAAQALNKLRHLQRRMLAQSWLSNRRPTGMPWPCCAVARPRTGELGPRSRMMCMAWRTKFEKLDLVHLAPPPRPTGRRVARARVYEGGGSWSAGWATADPYERTALLSPATEGEATRCMWMLVPGGASRCRHDFV
jgi:hypothetical protein